MSNLGKKVAAFLLFLIALTPLSLAEQKPTKYNEYAFQCSAVYGIAMKLYEAQGDKENASIYKRKFDAVAIKAEEQFKKIGKSKAEADNYIQDYATDLAARAAKNGVVIPTFLKICRNVFPEI